MCHLACPSRRSVLLACVLAASLFLLLVAGRPSFAAGTLAIGSSGTGSLSAGTQQEWWFVTTPADGTLTVRATSAAALNADLEIWNPGGNSWLAFDNRAGTYSSVERKDLAPATYRVRVTRGSGAGSYTITAAFTAAPLTNDPEPNDTSATAVALTLGGGVRTGHLGYSTGLLPLFTQDWYKVTTTSDGILKVDATTLSPLDIDLEIWDTNAQAALSFDNGAGLTSHVQSDDRAPGTYYVRVLHNRGYGGYIIGASFTPQRITNDVEPNNTWQTARTLASGGTLTGHLGYRAGVAMDATDYYKVTTTGDGTLQVNVSSESTLKYNVDLWGPNGSGNLAWDSHGGPNSQVIRRDLAPGTYYVRIWRASGHGGYSVSARTSPVLTVNDTEPNNAPEQAQATATPTLFHGHLGYYGTTDATDCYRLYVGTNGILEVYVVSDASLEINLDLWAPNGSLITSNNQTGVRSRIYKTGLTAGHYCLRVMRVSGYGGYVGIFGSPITYQPDLLIRPETEPESQFASRNVHHVGQAGPQVRAQTVLPGSPAGFIVRVVNDGSEARALVLKAQHSGVPATFRYFYGTLDITTGLTSAWQTPVIPAWGCLDVKVQITLGATATVGQYAASAVRVHLSATDATTRDVVYARAVAGKALPDLMVRASTEPENAFDINGQRQTTPSGPQIETQSRAAGGRATYLVKVENDGSAESTFVLRAAVSSEAGWTLRFMMGATNITSAITGSGYQTPVLAPGGSIVFSVEVTPGTAVPVNTRKTVTLRVYLSSTDTTVRDSIQCATVKMGTAAPQLLGPADGEETSALPALVLTAGQPAGEPVRFAIELASGDNVACFTSDPVESGAEAGLVLPEELRLPAGEWRWRAKAIDATGAESDWSETGRFVVVDE